jgi:hypothetical protein
MSITPWRWLLLILIPFAIWNYWPEPAVDIAPNDPVQSYADQGKHYQHGKYDLEILANFDIEARVLSKMAYDSGTESELAPVDLALGWGPMSNSSILDKLSISQSGRFYYYRWQDNPPIEPVEMGRHSSNMHLIPSSPETEKLIRDARVGQVVHIVGHLVEARATNGWHWRSSLTRDDSGAGACEVVRVESITLR